MRMRFNLLPPDDRADIPPDGSRIPQSRFRSVAFPTLVVLVALSVIGLFSYLSRGAPELAQPHSVPSELLPAGINNFQELEQAVLRKSHLAFPEPQRTFSVSASRVPAEIAALVLQGAQGVSYRRIRYERGGEGYRATFTLTGSLVPLHKQYMAIIEKAGWEFVAASYTDLFSFIDARNKTYQVRIRLTYSDASLTQVTLEASPHYAFK